MSKILITILLSFSSISAFAKSWKSNNLDFPTNCVERHEGQKIIVSFVGDVLLHDSLQRQAKNEGNSFHRLWKNVENVFQSADLSYANLEGPAAKGLGYKGFPLFNFPPYVIGELKNSGFDVLSTANNHSLDRKSEGVDKTIDTLNQSGMPYTGTRKKGSDAPFHTVTEVYSQKGQKFRIGWLACTFSTNGLPDNHNQVLDCYKRGKSNPLVTQIISELSKSVDGVILTPHWGPNENTHSVSRSQIELAEDAIDAGAIAVVGAHPHVLQPWEKYPSRDGNRVGLIHYSLGNFISNQRRIPQRASMILLVGFQKDRAGKLAIDGVKFIPTYMKILSRDSKELTALNRGVARSNEAEASFQNIMKIFPEASRLDSTQNLTTCN